jgi:hypothetical protein
MSEHCRTDGGIGTVTRLFNYPENDERTDGGIGTAARLFNYPENDEMTAEQTVSTALE